MADHLESLAWHVTAGVTRGTRNEDKKVGPALTARANLHPHTSVSLERLQADPASARRKNGS
jgi:hypothetical protein